ncbi:stomatin-like protein 1 isoform X3 [Rhineura floridana]|uniref:stomatin-like protein 1 isoform X3 n=1 Tax=Rhineura floridana TaxID=261503 RepID=UPI002AC80E3B|nr:stomatin-like protein 1 isoform X3 [Rhineura floridana]
MFSRSGYQALPLGDIEQLQQSSNWLNDPQRGFLSPGHTWNPLEQVQKGSDSPQGCLSWVCHGMVTAFVFLITALLFPISGWFVLKIVPAYERITVFRLGRIRAPQGPGVVLLLPFIDHWQPVDLRTRAFSIPPCKVKSAPGNTAKNAICLLKSGIIRCAFRSWDTIRRTLQLMGVSSSWAFPVPLLLIPANHLTSRDGVLVSVGADVQFRVWDPVLSVMMVKDLNLATRMTAQNAMTKILLKKYLQEIQTEKLRIGDQLLLEINDITKSWGLEVDRVELILESVLQMSQENITRPPGSVPPIPGLEELDSTIQQLALHFFGKTLVTAATNSNGVLETAKRVEVAKEVEQPSSTISTEPSSSSEGREFNAKEHLFAVERYLSESLVNQVRACYQINILLPSGAQTTYFIDLSADPALNRGFN